MKHRLTTIMIVLFVLSQATLFGFGQTESPPPQVRVGNDSLVYISPDTSPGIQDELSIPIQVEPAKKRAIKALYWIIYDQNDRTVRTNEMVYNGPKAGLFQKEKGIEIPKQIIWDGKNDAGEIVNDGIYYYQVEALDDQENRGSSRIRQVVVDNTPPQIELTAPHTVFSPIESAGRDLFIIEQEGSYEKLWVGKITDGDGNTLRSFVWEKSRPKNFSWNGRDEDDELADDGSYIYTVSSTDEAGNSTEKEFSDIVIDTTDANIEISRSLSAFSPNGDGVKDELTFTIDIPVTKNLLEWSLDIVDAGDSSVRSFEGFDAPEKELNFDGKDGNGAILPDGTYQATLSALYRNGNNPKSGTAPFIIDTTAPEVSVKPESSRFSPDGDGTKDSVTFLQTTSREDSWKGTITNQSGDVVLEVNWRGKAEESFTWDGRDKSDRLLPDGQYLYQLSSTDTAGNTGTSDRHEISIETVVSSDISLTLNRTHISPDEEEGKGTVTLNPAIEDTEGIDSFILNIINSSGSEVWKRESSPEAWSGEPVQWNGRNTENKIVSDGSYKARFTVIDHLGNRKSIEHKLQVDKTKPEIDLAAEYTLFSPNGDGRRDEIVIRQDSSDEKLWEGYIIDEKSNKLRSFFWKGQAEDLTWDGRDDEGNLVPDGSYSYLVEAVDEAGNRREVRLEGIEIDTRPTPVDLRWSEEAFSPNNDGRMDEVNIDLYIELQDGIESWELRVLDNNDRVWKIFTGDEKIPKNISWDGTTEKGETAKEGSYKADLKVNYTKGNLAEQRTENSAVLDVTGPDLELSLKPERFSPNNDGREDLQHILIKADDENRIARWSTTIHDPRGEDFYTRSGEGALPEEIEWDGRSSDDELVQTAEEYPLTFQVFDSAGNRTEKRKIISVDIFATKKDGKLIIEVSSLLFAPDSAEFTDFSRYSDFYEGQKEKNMKILDQVARMLQQYKDYSILIEGHGVLVHWDNPERAEQEQEEELIPLTKKRAEAVKTALVERGIASERISTVGVGGANPAFPFQDRENRWKNRRVVFILEK